MSLRASRWFKPTNVVTLFHNPDADISYSAMIVLRQAQLYHPKTNPRPISFDLDIIEPPVGMTLDQRRVIEAIIGYQNQVAAEKAAKEGSKFTPASTVQIEPPLVVSWMTNEVATGSIKPLEEMLQRMREKQWAVEEVEKREPTPFQHATRRFKSWWYENE